MLLMLLFLDFNIFTAYICLSWGCEHRVSSVIGNFSNLFKAMLKLLEFFVNPCLVFVDLLNFRVKNLKFVQVLKLLGRVW